MFCWTLQLMQPKWELSPPSSDLLRLHPPHSIACARGSERASEQAKEGVDAPLSSRRLSLSPAHRLFSSQETTFPLEFPSPRASSHESSRGLATDAVGISKLLESSRSHTSRSRIATPAGPLFLRFTFLTRLTPGSRFTSPNVPLVAESWLMLKSLFMIFNPAYSLGLVWKCIHIVWGGSQTYV